MLLEATASPKARATVARRVNGIDNRQVLEFLRLVQGLKQVAELLAIEPTRPGTSGKPNSKRLTK